MRTIVEEMLPRDFLMDLGVFMQTAAQIELAVWQTTMHAEGIDVHSQEAYRAYVVLKLSTQGLLKRFRSSASYCPGWIAERIRAIADRIEQGLETRNLAAHGAFYWEQGEVRAAHYVVRGRGDAREFLEVKQPVTRQGFEEDLQAADQLLHEVINLRSMVYAWRYPNGLPWDDPLQVAAALENTVK